MSLPVLILTRKLLVGGLTAGPPPPPPPPPDPHFGVRAGFGTVNVDPAVAVSASFTIYRVNGDDAATDYSLTWTMVPPAVDPVTSAYLADAGYLTGKVVTFAAGQQSKVVAVNFVAIADPLTDLSADIVLSAPSHGVVDPSAASFTFAIPKAVVGPTTGYALGPDFTATWTPQLGNGVPTVVQLADGVEIDCSADQTDQNSNYMLWAKTALPNKANNGFTLTFSYTQLDTHLATQAGGVFAHLYPGVDGGQNSSNANPNLWGTGVYQDALLATGKASAAVLNKYGKGLRFSWDQDAFTPANSDQLRGHQMLADGTEGNLGGVDYAAPFLFDANETYRISVAYLPVASKMVWTKLKVSDNTTQTVTVTDPAISANIGSYLGFGVNSGRKARIQAVALTIDPLDIVNPPPGTKPWEDDPTQWAALPATFAAIPDASKKLVPNNAALTQLASAVAGDVFVITGNLTGSVTMTNRVGTKANPIIICGDTWGAKDTMRTWTATNQPNIRLVGCKHVYIMRLTFIGGNDNQSGNVNFSGACDHVSYERNWSYGTDGTNGTEITSLRVEGGSPVRYFRCRYNTHGGHPTNKTAGPLFRIGTTTAFPNHPKFGWVYNNWVLNIQGLVKSSVVQFGTAVMMSGNGFPDATQNISAAVYKNLFDLVDLISEGLEFKNSGWTVADNTFLRDTGKDLWSVRCRQGISNLIQGNLFVSAPGGPAQCGEIQLRGTGHLVINNWGVTLAAGVSPAQGNTPGGSTIAMHGGQVDATRCPPSALEVKAGVAGVSPGSPRPQCDSLRVGGNRLTVNLGTNASTVYTPPLGVTNCIVPKASGRSDRNFSVQLSVLGDKMYRGYGKLYSEFAGTPAQYGATVGTGSTDYATSLTAAGADYDAVPLRMLPAHVGVQGS